MLWVDKYRPKALDAVDYHEKQAERLKKLAAAGDLPHLLFYGPNGAGKKTRIMGLLRAVYGAGADKLRLEHRSFKPPTRSTTVDLTTIASNYHIEINPGDAGIYDRFVVQEVIKEMAAFKPLEGGHQFKVVLLTEVDRLTKEAQHALRRTMEKYTASCRLILCCNSPSKVIDPVQSRCLGIRVPAPSTPAVMGVLESVAAKEGVTLPKPLAARIAGHSRGNMRRALLMFEACHIASAGSLSPDATIQMPDWEMFIAALAARIMADQTPMALKGVREGLYELLINCIPADTIIMTLAAGIRDKLPPQHRAEVASWAAYYEHRLNTGSKEILHLEGFAAKMMMLAKGAAMRRGGR
jgi:replication factor C subunit 3/5